MKIAIPTKNEMVENHFGQCEYYTVYETDENKHILSKELFRTSGGCGCKSNVAGILNQMGVSVMLAGNMGQGALNKLLSYEIEVIKGCEGVADELIESYVQGKLSDKDIICQQHNCDHE